jgi:predicted amidohydrolase
MTSLRVGLVQMEIADGRARLNLDRAVALVRAAPQADLYLLPELWSTGYAHATWRSSAETETPVLCEALQRLSAERDARIAGSMISVDEEGRLTNRLWLFTPDGRSPATYDKGHLFSPLQEDRYLAAGTRRVRVAIDGWTAALSICFDLRFPEMYRRDALEGANLFLVVAEWPAVRVSALRILARARAIENHAFLALCNRPGVAADGLAFGGGSALFAPDGSVVADAGAGERVIVGTLDGQVVAAARSVAPVLDLRRAGLDW